MALLLMNARAATRNPAGRTILVQKRIVFTERLLLNGQLDTVIAQYPRHLLHSSVANGLAAATARRLHHES